MVLTAYQEEQLMRQYDKLLWRVVHRFKRKMHGGYNNEEDLHSECAIVFLKHIRSCETMDEIKKVPILSMVNAMCKYVLGEQVVSYPRRTSNFRHVMENVVGKADLSEIDKSENNHYDPIGDALDMVAFRDFFFGLPPVDQDIIIAKLKGRKNREIARDLDVTDVVMTRAIQKLRKFYLLRAA